MNLEYFKRDIYQDMLLWKSSLSRHKTSLEVEGARQVGKSFIVKKFAEENFKKAYHIDLFTQKDRQKIEFASAQMMSTLEMFQLFFSDFVDDSESVLVIDEVQDYPRAYNLLQEMALRFKTNLIVTGSFLGKTLSRDYVKIGAERKTLIMRSLSFPEFLNIFGEREMYDEIDLYGGSSPDQYEQLRKRFKLYMFIGGYPRVVKEILEGGSLVLADQKLEEVFELFVEDSERYFTDILELDILRPMFDAVARFLLWDKRGSVKFRDVLSTLEFGKVTTQQTLLRCLSWLEHAHIVLPCGEYQNLDTKLARPKARYYFEDIGLARYLFNRVGGGYESTKTGRLLENYVFRCVLDKRILRGNRPYCATSGDYELDFFDIVSDGEKGYRVAIEVKSSDEKGKSASDLLKAGKLDYIVYARGTGYGGRAENVLTIPVFLFERFHINDIIPAVDYSEILEMNLF